MNLRNRIKNSPWRGVLALSAGTVIAQALNILIQPLLTRLISPSALGVYLFVISMSTVIIPVASLKMDMLIVIEKEDRLANKITDACIISVVLLSSFYLVIILALFLLNITAFAKVGAISLLIPAVVLFNGIRFVFISYNNRYKEYKLISKTNVLREAYKGAIQISSGLLKFGASGLVFGYMLSPMLILGMQISTYTTILKSRVFIRKVEYVTIIKKFWNHILIMVPSQFINSLSMSIIVLSVTSLYSMTEVGYYSISYQVLALPLLLISGNVSRVFLQKISEDYRHGKSMWLSYKKITKNLGLISIIIFILIALIAPIVSSTVFGKGYEETGKYISLLSFMYAFRFIASSISGAYVIFKKQKYSLIFNSLITAAGGIIYLVAKITCFDIYTYFTIISVVYGCVYIAVITSIGYICKRVDTENLSM